MSMRIDQPGHDQMPSCIKNFNIFERARWINSRNHTIAYEDRGIF